MNLSTCACPLPSPSRCYPPPSDLRTPNVLLGRHHTFFVIMYGAVTRSAALSLFSAIVTVGPLCRFPPQNCYINIFLYMLLQGMLEAFNKIINRTFNHLHSLSGCFILAETRSYTSWSTLHFIAYTIIILMRPNSEKHFINPFYKHR